jgi:hypothetical protein
LLASRFARVDLLRAKSMSDAQYQVVPFSVYAVNMSGHRHMVRSGEGPLYTIEPTSQCLRNSWDDGPQMADDCLWALAPQSCPSPKCAAYPTAAFGEHWEPRLSAIVALRPSHEAVTQTADPLRNLPDAVWKHRGLY